MIFPTQIQSFDVLLYQITCSLNKNAYIHFKYNISISTWCSVHGSLLLPVPNCCQPIYTKILHTHNIHKRLQSAYKRIIMTCSPNGTSPQRQKQPLWINFGKPCVAPLRLPARTCGSFGTCTNGNIMYYSYIMGKHRNTVCHGYYHSGNQAIRQTDHSAVRAFSSFVQRLRYGLGPMHRPIASLGRLGSKLFYSNKT